MSARILAVVTDAFGGFGGIAQFNRDFLTALADSEAVAKITVLPRLANSAAANLPPKIEQLSPLNGRLSYSIKTLQLTRSHGPFEVVFCGHMYLLPLAAAISKAIGAKLWLQTHGIDAWGSQSRLKQWGIGHADLVTSVSRHTRHQLLGSCTEVHPAKIRVLPNTVDRRF